MTRKDHLPFLEAIVADPESDDPRLIYADWLDERGDPRGEFIRVQCQMDGMIPAGPAFDALSAQSEELLTEYGIQWANEIVENSRYLPEFHRGFLKRLDVRASHFSSQHKILTSASPYHWVRLTHINSNFDDWIGSGMLQNVSGLDLSGVKLLPQQLKEILAASPNLKRFKLSYSRVGFDANLAKIFASAPCFSTLTHLSIKSNAVTEDFFPTIANAGGFVGLEKLEFGRARKGIPIEGVSATAFPSLREVTVILSVRVSELEILAQLPRLNSIRLKWASIADRGIQKMIDAGCIKRLERIEFSETNTNEKGMKALLGSDLSNCRYLDFFGGNANLTESCWRTLAANPTLTKLEHLKLYHEQLNDQYREILADLPVREVASYYRI